MESTTTTMDGDTFPSCSSISASSVRQPLPKAQVFILPKHRKGAYPSASSPSPTSSPTSSTEPVSPRAKSSLPESLRGRVRLLDVPRFDDDHVSSAPSSPSVPSSVVAPVLPPPTSGPNRKALILGDLSPTQTMSVQSMQIGVIPLQPDLPTTKTMSVQSMQIRVIPSRTGQDLEQINSIAETVASHYAYDDFMSTKKKRSIWKRFTGRVKEVAGSFYGCSTPPPTPPFTPK